MLARYTKQPGETHDYEFDWSDYFANRSDTYLVHVIVVPTGITLVGSTFANNMLRVLLTGGTDGQQYKITITLTTTSGVVEEEEFLVRVKES